jgi:hypothetical protein
VWPKDPTNAARQRRHRAKRKAEQGITVTASLASAETEPLKNPGENNANVTVPAASVTVQDAPPPVPDGSTQASKRNGRGVAFAIMFAALGLAAVSGGFSISGMTAIFVGAYWPVIGMGVVLEVGKLSAVAWLGHHNNGASWIGLKGAISLLVLVLMGLNIVGVYGFLAKAHIGHQIEGETAIASRMAEIQGRISVQEGVVASLDRQIAQIDKAVETATAKGRAVGAMQLATDQKRNRTDLVTKRDQTATALAGLKVAKAGIEGQAKVADADLGPLRYFAMLLGAGDQDVLRWFILVVASLLDPAAVLLLLAATRP